MQDMLNKMLQDQIKKQLSTQISNSLGVKGGQAQDMIENSLPYLLGGLKKNTSSKEGAESLLKALKSGKHNELTPEQLEALVKDPEAGEGAGILKHLLGEKENTVEKDIAAKAGVNPAEAKKTMMVMAPMIMAALGKMVNSDKLNADKLSDVVTGLSKDKNLGGAGMKIVMQMLDQDGDGDLKDDFFRVAKRWVGQKLTKK